jgi:ABC-type uncharacterized transport system permease subunit
VTVADMIGFLAAAVRVGTPLGLAAIGETVGERSGVINLGIEGAMLAGAFAAAAVATSDGAAAGLAAGCCAGIVVAALFALIAVVGRGDQIIAGTAITLAATGMTGLLAQHRWGSGGAGLSIPTLDPTNVPILSGIPGIGPVLFHQAITTYLCYAAFPLVGWFLYRTRSGLQLRATGESASSAAAAGVAVRTVRIGATLFVGLMGGLAGATLVLAQVGTFTERMTAGRGFIAIAIVALGRWRPSGVAAATVLFGVATAAQYFFQASGSAVPYQLFLALPYLLALGVLAASWGQGRGPAALGRSD